MEVLKSEWPIKNCITHLVNFFPSIWLEPLKLRHLPLVVTCHYGEEFVSIFITDFQMAVGLQLIPPQPAASARARLALSASRCRVCAPGPHLGSCALCPLQFVNIFFELRALKLIPVFQQQEHHHFWVLRRHDLSHFPDCISNVARHVIFSSCDESTLLAHDQLGFHPNPYILFRRAV